MGVITIIGAGMMGSAMSVPAAANGHEVRITGTSLDRQIIDELKAKGYHITLKRKLSPSAKYYQIEEIDKALEGCDLLIGGISSFGIDWFGKTVLPKVPESVPVLLVTKGLYATPDGRLTSFPDYLCSLPGNEKLSINAVGGPCISFELADRHDTAVAFCGHDKEILKKIKNMLSTDYYHINLSTDVIGIETAVAMKNAYALGVSLAIGIAEQKNGPGSKEEYNQQAGLFSQSIREMSRILKMTGGKECNISYGAGDLYVTIFGGRTRKIGTLLGLGLPFEQALQKLDGMTLESVAIAKIVTETLKMQEIQGKLDTKQFPLLMHIYDLITGKTTVNIPWQLFEEETAS
jgi:glycerol-3-phosphate dehydrogenase (NAD(P)+)